MTSTKLQDDQPPRHWHVLGHGAIGALFTRVLQGNSKPVTWLVRNELAANERQRLGPIMWYESDRAPIPLATTISHASETQYISHLLITTKAFDVKSALINIAHRIDEATEIILMTNGLGVREELDTALPGLTLYNGTTTAGAYRSSQEKVTLTGQGNTRIGSSALPKKKPEWLSDFSSKLINVNWSDDIEKDLIAKLAINCAINPLTAILNCENGALARTPHLNKLVAVCDEISAVLRSSGYTNIAETLRDQALLVVNNTANNRSSMLQDIDAGRKTEIHYITGYLLTMAQCCSVSVPLNTQLFKEVNALEIN